MAGATTALNSLNGSIVAQLGLTSSFSPCEVPFWSELPDQDSNLCKATSSDSRSERKALISYGAATCLDPLRAQWGSVKYDSAHALYEWVVYLLLGKLNSGFYLLEKAATIHGRA